MTRILCCGSRTFSNVQMVVDVLSLQPLDTVIIEGEARGTDTICKLVGQELGFKVEKYPAIWDRGKKAGMDRNSKMLEKNIDKVIAFRDKRESPGTNDTIFKASVLGIPCEVYDDF